MMNFRIIKDALIELLENNTKQCFTVISHQKQRKSAKKNVGDDRSVTVYYLSGDFPKTSASIKGKTQHEITYRLELTVASPAKGNISILNNPNALAAEYSTALENFQEASSGADELFDELADIVYQIIMDPVNLNIGLAKGIVANRWIEQIQKDQLQPRGELAILTGSMFLKLKTEETFVGLPAKAFGDLQDVTIDLDGDEIEKTGTIVNSP